MKRVSMKWATVYANGTSERKIPATGWMPAGQLIGARAVVEIRERVGDIEVGVGLEVANVPNSPTGSIQIEARHNTTGVFFGPDFTALVNTTKNSQLARLVYLTANTSSSDTTLARAGGYVEFEERC